MLKDFRIEESEGHLCNTCYLAGVDRKATHKMEARIDDRNVHLYVCDEHVGKWKTLATHGA